MYYLCFGVWWLLLVDLVVVGGVFDVFIVVYFDGGVFIVGGVSVCEFD